MASEIAAVIGFSPEIAPDGYVELNGIWAVLDASVNKRPTRLLDYPAIREYVCELREQEDEPVYRRQGRGRAQKIFAHPVLALEIVRRLSPSFSVALNRDHLAKHAACRAAMNRVAEHLQTTIRALLGRCNARAQVDGLLSELRYAVRTLGGDSRDTAAVGRARYLGLYQMAAFQVARQRGLNPKQLLEHMGVRELGGHVMVLRQAGKQSGHIGSIDEFCEATLEIADETREILELMGFAPIEQPVESHINDVRKQAAELFKWLDQITQEEL